MNDPGLDEPIAENAKNIEKIFEDRKGEEIEQDYLAPKYTFST